MASRTSSDTQKVTVSLPASLLERLKERVPSRQRSSFIADAVEERLALEDQWDAIEESAGSWKDQDHPELMSDVEIDAWLAELRRSWHDRLESLGVLDSEEG